jgi:DNA-binding transcriptional ArsR family regulator
MIQEPKTEVQPYEVNVQLFKLLTHPVRLAILGILRDGEHCVCHMEAHLGLRQAYISQQVAVLREAGLIQDRRDGWNIFYRVTDPRIYSVLDTIQLMTGRPAASLQREGIECPCPHCSSTREKA